MQASSRLRRLQNSAISPWGRHYGKQHSSATNPDREGILNDIARKWSKFSKQDLTDITTNDQLVGEVVKRYGNKKEAAQREVDILMDGRNLSP